MGGLFTWPIQDDRMNMTEIGEYDRKIDNDEHLHGEFDQNYNKYYHNDEPYRVNMTESRNYTILAFGVNMTESRNYNKYSKPTAPAYFYGVKLMFVGVKNFGQIQKIGFVVVKNFWTNSNHFLVIMIWSSLL